MNAPKSTRAAARSTPEVGSRRLGRPSSPRNEVRGNRVVTFVTDAQLAELQRLALQDGTSLSGACFRILQANLDKFTSRNEKI
jgi:hypothetical protein